MGCRAGGAGTFVGVLQADAARLYPGCMSNVLHGSGPALFSRGCAVGSRLYDDERHSETLRKVDRAARTV